MFHFAPGPNYAVGPISSFSSCVLKHIIHTRALPPTLFSFSVLVILKRTCVHETFQGEDEKVISAVYQTLLLLLFLRGRHVVGLHFLAAWWSVQ